MTKSELIQKLAKKFPHLYIRDIEKLVNTVFGEITSAMAGNRRIELRGFGAFSVRKREGRKARNPKTGEEVFVGTRYVPYFRLGKDLRNRLNADEA